ncbi:MAG: 23S rRNA (adenine(2503)-C(2))-methyltransferase RlmN [Clostridia bacterium]|nr:23S rRNA (adenine(2503)-C(2))-methyltransferase RlmN [Clostridia bacterium]
MKRSLLDLDINELKEELLKIENNKFRYKQVYSWLQKGASFDEMTNIPKSLVEILKDNYSTGHAGIHTKLVSEIDGTIKYIFELHDGVLVEGVLMPYDYGNTFCMSTQAGCSMACAFCSSALDGKTRDLTDGDMLAQIIAVTKDAGGERPVNNIVMMGSGEPFDNYENTVRFLRRINSENSLNIGFRSISLSTCGLVEKMDRFTEENIPVTMCISLHGGNDETRQKIMPIANKYAIAQTIDAARRYFNKTGRRIIIEYVLIDGVNDDRKNAEDLAKAIKGLNCNVNIIRLNEGREGFSPSSRNKTAEFIKALSENKVKAILRRNMGSDVNGACGQLRHNIIGED